MPGFFSGDGERGPLFGGLGLAALASSIIVAAVLRPQSALDALDEPVDASAASGAPSDRPRERSSSDAPGAAVKVVHDDPSDLTDDAVDAARSIAELEALGAKYPADLRVLRKLTATYEREPAPSVEALLADTRLFHLAPDEASLPAHRRLISDAAASATQTIADAAFDLMSKDMGPSGPDLLWETATGTTPAAHRATLLLRDEGVRKLESPALLVAVDLQAADGCARKPFLPAAERDGDARSIPPLQQALPMHKGCGFLGLGVCGDCFGDRSELNRAINAIQARSKKP